MTVHQTFLVYTRDDERRRRLAKHIADQADGRIVAVQKSEHVDRVAEQYEIAGVIVDINSHDRNVRNIMKAVRGATWIVPPAIVYIYDDTESTIGFMVEERADWLSRKLANREVVRRLLAAVDELTPGELVDSEEAPPLDQVARIPTAAKPAVPLRMPTVTPDPWVPISSTMRDELKAALDAIEAQLDSSPEDLDDLAASLERSAAALDVTELGPATSELLASTLEEPTEDLLRGVIERLRGITGTAGKPLVVCIGGDEEALAEVIPELPHCRFEFIPNADSLVDMCDRRWPDVVVVLDTAGQTTARTLQLLRYVRQVQPLPVIIKLEGDRSGLGEASDYGVTSILGPETSHEELATHISQASEISLHNRPIALVLDLDRTLALDLRPALREIGAEMRLIHKLADFTAAAGEVDVVFLASKYKRVSGIDTCRSLSHELKMLRPPVVLLASDGDMAEVRKQAFQAGVDDVLALNVPAVELARRSRLLIENYRLRLRNAELDHVTGVNHVCGLSRRLYSQLCADRESSLFMVDVDSFSTLRQSYGQSTARTVLRSLADHLATIFGADFVFRDWTDRFVVLGPNPHNTDEMLEAVSEQLLAFKRITFRSQDGRGFYATISSAHLLVPKNFDEPQAALSRLTRILSRAKRRNRGGFLSATMDPESIDNAPSISEYGIRRRRWEPVVLTRQND